MKSVFIFSFILLTIAVNAQTLSSSLTSSGGASLSSGNVLLTVSMGQPLAGDVSASSVAISQGFLMSTTEKVVTAILEKDIILNVFPNPVTEQLFIQSERDLGQLNIELIDMNGRKIFVKQVSSPHSIELELSGVAPALYLLRLQHRTGEVKIISIIKSNQ